MGMAKGQEKPGTPVERSTNPKSQPGSGSGLAMKPGRGTRTTGWGPDANTNKVSRGGSGSVPSPGRGYTRGADQGGGRSTKNTSAGRVRKTNGGS